MTDDPVRGKHVLRGGNGSGGGSHNSRKYKMKVSAMEPAALEYIEATIESVGRGRCLAILNRCELLGSQGEARVQAILNTVRQSQRGTRALFLALNGGLDSNADLSNPHHAEHAGIAAGVVMCLLNDVYPRPGLVQIMDGLMREVAQYERDIQEETNPLGVVGMIPPRHPLLFVLSKRLDWLLRAYAEHLVLPAGMVN